MMYDSSFRWFHQSQNEEGKGEETKKYSQEACMSACLSDVSTISDGCTKSQSQATCIHQVLKRH